MVYVRHVCTHGLRACIHTCAYTCPCTCLDTCLYTCRCTHVYTHVYALVYTYYFHVSQRQVPPQRIKPLHEAPSKLKPNRAPSVPPVDVARARAATTRHVLHSLASVFAASCSHSAIALACVDAAGTRVLVWDVQTLCSADEASSARLVAVVAVVLALAVAGNPTQ